MNPPTIGVVLPLFNHEQFIIPCLNSILEQTSPVDEIILIDDGSSDKGFAIAREMLGSSPKATLLTQPNCGAPATLNRAVELTQSDYIAVLNTDDRFAPTKIERCRQLLQHEPRIELICGAASIIDNKGRIMMSGEAVSWLHQAMEFQLCHQIPDMGLLHDNYVVTTSNMVFSRSLWEKCDGFQNLRYCHDLDFLLTALSLSTVKIDREQTHTYYRVHAANTIGEKSDTKALELAAVMANTMVTNSSRLVNEHNIVADIMLLCEILAVKKNARLVCALQVLRRNHADRRTFYNVLLDEKTAQGLVQQISLRE